MYETDNTGRADSDKTEAGFFVRCSEHCDFYRHQNDLRVLWSTTYGPCTMHNGTVQKEEDWQDPWRKTGRTESGANARGRRISSESTRTLVMQLHEASMYELQALSHRPTSPLSGCEKAWAGPCTISATSTRDHIAAMPGPPYLAQKRRDAKLCQCEDRRSMMSEVSLLSLHVPLRSFFGLFGRVWMESGGADEEIIQSVHGVHALITLSSVPIIRNPDNSQF